mmetsp:Transcript_26313/g.63421  ORF Transcript_26313/g.63421 Transcript_26313/m.63421 type:complete len:117 (+) Transcript_26313:832-1182(+)
MCPWVVSALKSGATLPRRRIPSELDSGYRVLYFSEPLGTAAKFRVLRVTVGAAGTPTRKRVENPANGRFKARWVLDKKRDMQRMVFVVTEWGGLGVWTQTTLNEARYPRSGTPGKR